MGLLVAVLFVLISASVEPPQLWDPLPKGIALLAVMMLVLRPLAVAPATWRSELSRGERAFIAWLAPRGIVAAATASVSGLQLAQAEAMRRPRRGRDGAARATAVVLKTAGQGVRLRTGRRTIGLAAPSPESGDACRGSAP